MIQSVILYISYAIATIALVILSFINIAPQFGANPTIEQKRFYETFPNYEEGGFKSLEETPMMTGELSTWDFFKKDSSRQPQGNIITKKVDYHSFLKNQIFYFSILFVMVFLLQLL